MKKILIILSLITFFFIENIFCKKDNNNYSIKRSNRKNYVDPEINDSFDRISSIEEKNTNKKSLKRSESITNKRRSKKNPMLPFLHKNTDFSDENSIRYGVVPQKNKPNKNKKDYISANNSSLNGNLNDLDNMNYNDIEKMFSGEGIDINEILNDDSIDWGNMDFDNMDFDYMDF